MLENSPKSAAVVEIWQRKLHHRQRLQQHRCWWRVLVDSQSKGYHDGGGSVARDLPTVSQSGGGARGLLPKIVGEESYGCFFSVFAT